MNMKVAELNLKQSSLGKFVSENINGLILKPAFFWHDNLIDSLLLILFFPLYSIILKTYLIKNRNPDNSKAKK